MKNSVTNATKAAMLPQEAIDRINSAMQTLRQAQDLIRERYDWYDGSEYAIERLFASLASHYQNAPHDNWENLSTPKLLAWIDAACDSAPP